MDRRFSLYSRNANMRSLSFMVSRRDTTSAIIGMSSFLVNARDPKSIPLVSVIAPCFTKVMSAWYSQSGGLTTPYGFASACATVNPPATSANAI